MPYYRIWPTGERIEIPQLKNYTIPFAGAKVLIKERPNVAREVSTD
jgi:DNA-directed RNA polymerase subunit RPC12/RpoP